MILCRSLTQGLCFGHADLLQRQEHDALGKALVPHAVSFACCATYTAHGSG